MSKESFVFFIGLVVFFIPFLGVPRDYKDWIAGIAGALLMWCGYQLRRRRFLLSITHGEERKSNAFSESITETKVELPPETSKEQ